MPKISNYFLITPPKNYEFIGYYNYRRRQPDFTFSFEKESYLLAIELHKLIKESHSQEITLAASRLLSNHKASCLI